MREQPKNSGKSVPPVLLLLLFSASLVGYLSLGGLTLPSFSLGRPGGAVATPAGGAKRIGVIAGHWENDSGAVCPDGLKEVDITVDVAQRVVQLLEKQGHRAEMLAEFSTKLPGYQADALVSIHVDSCLKGRSGFKVARVAQSAVPESEDRLVACLYEAYEKATGLARDEHTITPAMTNYHAFREIAPDTPGAIIEIGFLGGDARLLTRSPQRAAQGVASGILCFLQPIAPSVEKRKTP